jgi:hypothetical protein
LTWPEQVMTEYGYAHHCEANIKEDEWKYLSLENRIIRRMFSLKDRRMNDGPSRASVKENWKPAVIDPFLT